MDEGNEFESIEVDDFESADIENMDSTPETAEDLSLIMDEEIQGLPEEELIIPDDDSLEGDFDVQEPLPEDIPEAVEMPEAEPLPEEFPEDMPEETGRPIEESAEDVSAMDAMTEYITEHNYGKEDYETYSKDPEWQELNNRLLEEEGREPIDYGEPGPEESAGDVSAMDAMTEYITEHNYGKEDYETYSKDPEWQELNNRLLEEEGREPIDYGEPGPEESAGELPAETPETTEASAEELVSDEIPEETVASWMDDVAAEAGPEDFPDDPLEDIPDDLPEEVPETIETPEEALTPEEISDNIPEEPPTEMPEETAKPIEEENTENISAQEESIDYGEPGPEESAEEILEELPEAAPETVEAPGEELQPEERPEEMPETIEGAEEGLETDKITAEETVSTWMDDATLESTEEIELMDDDVELVDMETEEGLAEAAPEAEALAEETETVPDLENVSGWLNEVNPNFDPFDLDSPYCNNCGSCAYAVYQRLEGISTDSCASAENIGYNDEMEALTGMEQVPMTPAEIEERLLEQGDGAHAIIGIDRAEGPGHWFNAACLEGKVVAIDGQSGEILDWPPDYGNVVNWEMSIKKGD